MKAFNYLIIAFFIFIGGNVHSQSPQRIISLAPSLTKMIYLLENQNKLVGYTSYCDEAVKGNKTVIGNAVEVNMEKSLLLKPDLVIVTSLTKQSTLDAFKKAGIKTRIFPDPKSYSEICNEFIELAALTGKRELAISIVEKQKNRLSKIQQTIPKGKSPEVFFEIGSRPLFTVIPNTFMNDYILFTGCENIASDLKSGTITREAVLLRNPDVIFIVTMGIVGIEEKDIWERYKNISAVKNQKIFMIDSDKACSPNPVVFVDVVEQIVKMTYK